MGEEPGRRAGSGFGQRAWALLARYPRSIRGRLVALSIGVFLVFIWTLVYVSATLLQERFDAVLLEQQFATTQQVAAELDAKLDERIRLLSRAAAFVPAALTRPTLEAFLAERTSLQVIFSAGMTVIGLDGRTIADYPFASGQRDANLAERNFFRQVLTSKHPYIDKPVLDAALKRPVLTVAVPVLDAAGEVRAVLTGIIDLGAANFLCIVTDRALAGRGERLVFSRYDRLVVAATDKSRVLVAIPEPGANPIVDQAMAGFEGSGFGASPQGVPTLYSAKQVPTAHWAVLTALPTEVARRPVAEMRRYLYAIAAAITLLAALILWFMARRMLAPLEEAGSALRRMTAGEMPLAPLPVRSENEVGQLIGKFNRLLAERQSYEQALKALNRDFVTLLENTSDFIYFKDRDSRFRFCSQTLARITGHRHWRDMIGKHDLEVFPPDTARIYQEEELPVFRDGKPLLDRVDPYYDEAGQPGWVSTSKWPVFADDGVAVAGIFGISRIVTERVRAEEKLRAANQELQAFTYAASHDIKAPLGRINSFCTLLEKQYRARLEGDGLLFLDLIRGNAQRLSVLVEDLLAHAEIEQKILALQAVDLRATVEGIVREYAAEIRQGGVDIRVELPPLTVRAHPHGLAQVLRNLLENALKYSAAAAAPAVAIGARVRQGQCRVWVRDNGIGFDMAYHDRIFEVFRRLHTYDEFPGSGIGLALVKKAMERMGGKVWAQSRPGEGATFYLELKAEPGQAAPVPGNEEAPDHPQSIPG